MKKFVKKFVVGTCALGKAVGQCIALPLLRGLWRSLSGAFVFGGIVCALHGYALAEAVGRLTDCICLAYGSSALVILCLYLMWSIGANEKEDR